MIDAGCHFFPLRFGVAGQSRSNFLASTPGLGKLLDFGVL